MARSSFMGRLRVAARAVADVFSTSGRPDFDAAAPGGRLRGWYATSNGPNSNIVGSLSNARNRSREQYRNNATAVSAIDVLVREIVGTGARPRSQAPDPAVAEAIDRLFDEWSKVCDADGTQSFYGIQARALRTMFLTGDCLVRHRPRRAEDRLPVPYQIQDVAGDLLPHDKTELASNGNRIFAGIEFDRVGRRVAYHMYSQHPGDTLGWPDIGSAMTTRVAATAVSHVFIPRESGQVRGFPELSRVLVRLWDIDHYTAHELTRKRSAAAISGFLKQAVGDAGGADAPPFGAEAPDASGVADATFAPGSIVGLGPGEEFQQAKMEDGQPFDAFVRVQLQTIASGLGVLYEHLSGDYSRVNDRTIRAALLSLRREIESAAQDEQDRDDDRPGKEETVLQ
jgi:lambda family phage portal protein